MKTLSDLKLRKKTEKKVEGWIEDWIQHFIALADGREGTVYRADFEKMDLFFFTECNELVSESVESTAQEQNLEIRRRKRMVVLQLLLKTMKGEKIGRKIKCSHCGYDDVYIGSRPSGGGHYKFCPECGKTDVCTYPKFYDTTMDEVKNELVRLELLYKKDDDSEKRTCTVCGCPETASDVFTFASNMCDSCYVVNREG